jgi:diguanylate cyclase (GGDEF)-like protein
MPIDELTKLYDRRDLFNYLHHEVGRARRTGRSFSLMMIDIDHFKEVNDSFGHLRGDRVLIQTADIIRSNSRTMDIPCRYGGDEFVVILSETLFKNAEVVAQRLLQRICNQVFSGGDEQPDLHITVSIGIASYSIEIESAEVLLDRADKALYLAKQRGRNQYARDIEVVEEEPLPSLNFKGFIDRTEPLALLKSMFDSALRGKGCSVMISGEAGVGKTRLVSEVEKYASLNNGIFLAARPIEYGVTPPYRMFFQVIKDYFTEGDDERRACLKHVESVYREQIAAFYPELRMIMGVLESPPQLSPDLEKMRLFDAVSRVFEVMSQQTPLMVFLDNLHWARAVDFELLNYLLRNLSDWSILLCGAYRIEEVGEGHSLISFLRTMSREQYFEQIQLQGLNLEEVGDLLRTILGYPVKQHIIERINQETEGNPFYIEELTKSFVARGIVCWQDKHWAFNEFDDIRLPSSVNDLLLRRFEGVDVEVRELLTRASVIGEHFSLPLLREMTGKNEGYLLDILDQGIEWLLIEEAADKDYKFSHLYLRRVLYDGLSLHKRQWLHGRVGGALEEVYRDRLSEVYERMVYHFQIAEDWDRVFKYSLQAGKILQTMYAHREAVARFNACLSLIDNGHIADVQGEIEIHYALGMIYAFLGDYEKSVEHYTTALKNDNITVKQRVETTDRLSGVYLDRGDLDCALASINETKQYLDEKKNEFENAQLDIDLMWICMIKGEHDKVETLAEQGLRFFEKAQSPHHMAKIYNTLGVMHGSTGDWDKAQDCFRRALATQDKKKGPARYARLLNNLASVYASAHDYTKAIPCYEEALELQKKVGAQYMVSLLLINLAVSYNGIGKFKEAEVYVKKGLEIAQRIHNISLETHACATYTGVMQMMGDYERAVEYGLKAVDLAREENSISHLIQSQQSLASGYLGMEKYEEALRLFDDVINMCEKHNYKAHLCRCYVRYAEGLLALKKLDEALTYADKAIVLAASIRDSLTEDDGYITRGRIYFAQDELEKALSEFEQAVQLAEKIKNEYAIAKCFYYKGTVLKKQGILEQSRDSLYKAQAIFAKLEAEADLKLVKEELQIKGGK